MSFPPTRTVYRVTALAETRDVLCCAVATEVARKLADTPLDPDQAQTALISTIHLLARACATACSTMIPGHLVATPLAYYDSWRHGNRGPTTERMPPEREQILLMREALAKAERERAGR